MILYVSGPMHAYTVHNM